MDPALKHEKLPSAGAPPAKTEDSVASDYAPINASGHREELERNFGLVSIVSFAITSGNTWVSLGGTVVSI